MSTATAVVACRVCGVATSSNLAKETVYDIVNRPVAERTVGVCDACADLDYARPGVAVRAALRLLGKPEKDDAVAADVFSDAGLDVSALLYDMTRERNVPQTRAFAHVPKEFRADLKRAYVAVLDAKVHASSKRPSEPPPPKAPPASYALRGCAYCGVSAARPWARIDSYALSRDKTRMVTCVLCPACSQATDDAGDAIGARAWTLAFCRARGLNYQDDVRLPGLRPFALLDDPQPSRRPWAFAGDDVRYPDPPLTFDALAHLVETLIARVEALEEKQA